MVWSAADGSGAIKPLRHPNWVTHAAFSPDFQRIITACADGIARVWESESGKRIWPDLHHSDVLDRVEYSPDGRLILTASMDGIVRLWRADTLEPLSLNSILTHAERVTSAAFDPSGNKIVTACADGSVRVWDFAGTVATPAPEQRWYSALANRFLTVSNNFGHSFDALTGSPASPMINLGASVEHLIQNRDGQFAAKPVATGAENSPATRHRPHAPSCCTCALAMLAKPRF